MSPLPPAPPLPWIQDLPSLPCLGKVRIATHGEGEKRGGERTKEWRRVGKRERERERERERDGDRKREREREREKERPRRISYLRCAKGKHEPHLTCGA